MLVGANLEDVPALGHLVPSVHAPQPSMWEFGKDPRGTWEQWKEYPAGVVGDINLPFPLPHGASPPVQGAIDLAKWISGAFIDDAGVLDGIQYGVESQGRRSFDTFAPYLSTARKILGVLAAEDMFGVGELARRPEGFAGIHDLGPDWPSEKRFERKGYRGKASYAVSREVLWKMLLMPGVEKNMVMKEIRNNQMDRSLMEHSKINRVRGLDRLRDAVQRFDWDEAEEIVETYNLENVTRKQMQRIMHDASLPKWIRQMSGDIETKFDVIYRRWRRGGDPLEIKTAIDEHLMGPSSRNIKDPERIEQYGRMVLDVAEKLAPKLKQYREALQKEQRR
jgi:hypothetical protein